MHTLAFSFRTRIILMKFPIIYALFDAKYLWSFHRVFKDVDDAP